MDLFKDFLLFCKLSTLFVKLLLFGFEKLQSFFYTFILQTCRKKWRVLVQVAHKAVREWSSFSVHWPFKCFIMPHFATISCFWFSLAMERWIEHWIKFYLWVNRLAIRVFFGKLTCKSYLGDFVITQFTFGAVHPHNTVSLTSQRSLKCWVTCSQSLASIMKPFLSSIYIHCIRSCMYPWVPGRYWMCFIRVSCSVPMRLWHILNARSGVKYFVYLIITSHTQELFNIPPCPLTSLTDSLRYIMEINLLRGVVIIFSIEAILLFYGRR